ncbi:hypothetical protein KIH39_07180 [Telmatocola sphagniphila]|uniref:Type II/III secretion system secretin-like domain-containing protein n=1 Tax=Telmatocola sphagniphila TaxID=1123043 RepID=A0A8E6B9C5_9BACT|nr:hypothetical protein [Telmatocola sphagniphila]QVL33684.1 hypothetical protein KIH39_07180 [Telmatocola sphagniphila]
MLKKLFVAGLATALSFQSSFAQENQAIIRIKAHVFEVSDEAFRDLNLSKFTKGRDLEALSPQSEAKLLHDLQLRQDLKGDCSLIAMPQMATDSGRECTINVGHKASFLTKVTIESQNGHIVYLPKSEEVDLGFKLACTAKSSTDKQTINMNVKAEIKSLANEGHVPLFPITTVITPVYEGGSQGQPIEAIQYIQQPEFNQTENSISMGMRAGFANVVELGQEKRAVNLKCQNPILAEVPYLNRLFTQQKSSTCNIHYVMIVLADVLPATSSPACITVKEMPPSATTMTLSALNIPIQEVVPPQPIALTFSAVAPAPMTSIQPVGWTTVQVANTNALPAITLSDYLAQQAPPSVPVPPPVAVAPPALFKVAMPEACITTQDFCVTLPAEKVIRECIYTQAANSIAGSTKCANREILKILLEQYEVACKAGDLAKAKTIAAFCMDMDPTCFANR